MTDNTYTALVLIVDRSGSMRGIASQTQEALEELVNGQKQEPGKLTIDTVFFDDGYDERAIFANPKKEKLDLAIRPGGMTALYDAVGRKVRSFGDALEKLSDEKRPGTVIVVIATDGHENSSREFDSKAVAELIKDQQDKYGWKFTFIGANQDAILTAQALNISANDSITFAASAAGTQNVLRSVGNYISKTRTGEDVTYSAMDREEALAADFTEPKMAPVKAKVSAKAPAKKAPAVKKTP